MTEVLSSKGTRWDSHLQPRLCSAQKLLQDFFSCLYSLAQAWVDEMDFAAQNPLISSILNSISQITGVIYTVIALSGGHAQNFMLEGSVLFIFSCLPPIYTQVHGSHDEDTFNMQRNVIAEIHIFFWQLTWAALQDLLGVKSDECGV